MTTPIRAEVVRLPGDRATITGSVGEVGQMLARLQDTGRLVSATMPTPTGVVGQVLVNVRLAPQQREPARRRTPRRRMSRRTVVAIAAAALGGVAIAGWLLLRVLSAIAEHAATLLGALLLVAVVLVVIGKAGGGGGTFSGTFRGSMD